MLLNALDSPSLDLVLQELRKSYVVGGVIAHVRGVGGSDQVGAVVNGELVDLVGNVKGGLGAQVVDLGGGQRRLE